jgi:hypothetical protein
MLDFNLAFGMLVHGSLEARLAKSPACIVFTGNIAVADHVPSLMLAEGWLRVEVRLIVRSYQAAVAVRLGARLAGAQLALLSRRGPTGWATNRQGFPLGDLHRYIMQLCR